MRLQTELWKIRGEAQLQLGVYSEAAKAFKAIADVEKESGGLISEETLRGLATCMVETDDLSQSLQLCNDLIRRNPNDHWALATIGWTLFRSSSRFSDFQEEAATGAKKEDGGNDLGGDAEKLEKAVENLKRALEIEKQVFLYWHRLGLLYWTLGRSYRTEKDKAQHHFLQSAKLNPNYGPNFTYLGLFYQEVEKDVEKAKRCFQKAITLDPLDLIASRALSNLYISSGQVSLAESIYRQITAKVPRAGWAFLRLGLLQSDRKQLQDAVLSFQAALRTEPKSVFCWQALAEAYLQQGKFIAAMKAFSRTSELEVMNVYSRFQVATIKNMLKQHDEAIVDFQFILQQLSSTSPTSTSILPITKGLADAHLSLARQLQEVGSFDKASENLDEALKAVEKCQNLRPTSNDSEQKHRSLLALVKLLGDIHLCYAETLGKESKSRELFLEYRRLHLEYAAEAYLQAIELQPSLGSLHYDLGIVYYQHSLSSNLAKDVTLWKKKAILQFKRGITLESHNSIFWTALGLVEIKPSLQQHAFIRAIQLDPRVWLFLFLFTLLPSDFLFSSSFVFLLRTQQRGTILGCCI